MDSDLNLRLAAIRISTVARAYGMEVRERGLSRCVFHDDHTPSLSVTPSGKHGADLFNCFGCGAAGDVVGFMARLVGIDRRNAVKALLKDYAVYDYVMPPVRQPEAVQPVDVASYSLDEGEACDFEMLSRLRGISVPALKLAAGRGLLRFGCYARERAWVVVDPTGSNLQFRPLRPGLWFGKHKALSAKGASTKSPLGMGRLSQADQVHIVEGGPDLLAAHQVMLWMHGPTPDRVAAVAFLGASVDPSRGECEQFEGKHIVIWAHADKSGMDSAERKLELLYPHVRSASVLLASEVLPGAKDLNDIVSSPGGFDAILARREVFYV